MPPTTARFLVVDPYNDFMSEGGKLYDAIKETADASGIFGNLPRLRTMCLATVVVGRWCGFFSRAGGGVFR